MPTIRQRRKRTLDPTRTTTLRQAFARQLRKKFRKLKGKMYTWLVLQDSLSMTRNAFNPDQPRDEEGKWTSTGIGESSGKEGTRATVKVSAKLERKFHGSEYDAPEEGEIETYRIAIHDPKTGDRISHTSLMISRGTGIGRISDLETVKEQRGKGYASRLYRELVKIAKEKGVKELYSDTARKPQTSKIWKGLGAEEFRAPEGLVYRLVLNAFNPDQPRDETGKWTDAGGGRAATDAAVSATSRAVDHLVKLRYVYESFSEAPQSSSNAWKAMRKGDYEDAAYWHNDAAKEWEKAARALPESERKPLEDAVIAHLQASLVLKGAAEAPDWRPAEMLPEDFYASNARKVIKHFASGKHRGSARDEAEPTTNAPPMRFAFASSAEKLEAFREWLREQFEEELLDEDVWRRYTMEGFKRGAGRAFDDARAAEKATGQKPEDFWVGSKQEFLRSAFGRRESVEKVKLLASRSFTDLRNVTDDMATRMGRILADGLVAGKNPRDIADDLNATLQLGRNRSEVIARTEIIRAHAEGQLDAFDRLGIEDIGVMVEWSTAGDDRVCDACAPMEGAVFRVQEAHGMIPRHPQCRCAFIPANVGEETDSQLRTKGELGGAIQESLEAAGQDSDEWGPDTTITKSRPMSLLMDFSRLIHAENVFCPTGEGGGVDPSCSPGGGGGAPEQGWTGKHGSVGIVAELKPYERNKLTREENREFVRLRNEGIKLNRDARRDPEKRTPEARQRAKEIKARLVELRDKARAAVRPEEKQAFKEEQQRRRDEEIVRRAQEERQAAEGGREEGRSGPAIRGMQPMGGGGSGAAGVTPARSGDGIKLQGSPITNTKNLGGGANESKKVTFSDGTHGVWKPSDGEWKGLRDTVPDGTFYRREAAASSIAKITGMADLVPETVERNIGGKIGSMQRWVDNSRIADDAGDRMWNGEKDLARAAAFDMMIGNTDRHGGNWMVEKSTGKLALIDNGLAFPTGMEEHRSFIAYRAYSERMPVPKEVLDWDGAKIDRTLQEHKIEPEARELVQKRLHVLKESAKKDRPFPLFSTREREWDEALR